MRRWRTSGVLISLLLAPVAAAAQMGPTSAVAGVVVDTDRRVVPGATVTVTNTATADRYVTTSSATGTFLIPALAPGTYSVTVSLAGFKTATLPAVTATSGSPASVTVVLEVGAVEETVEVRGAGDVVQRQSSTVAAGISRAEIDNLPMPNRNILDLVTVLPGVNTPGTNRDSTINGLPQATINITLDGVNVQDAANRTNDGFFSLIAPRLDAVEEVTVTSAAQGADRSGHGAAQIRFVTRSGSNVFSGSVYDYIRTDALNENTWFNERDGLAKPQLELSEIGGRVGGPVVLPGYDGRNRLFFFGHYEESRQPEEVTRNRTLLTTDAQAGRFRYQTATGVNEVDLLARAAAGGHLASIDPTISTLLADIRGATSLAGVVGATANPSLDSYSWNSPREIRRRYSTVRLDLNATERHRLSGVFSYQHFLSDPDTVNNWDPVFPVFPVQATQFAPRTATSITLRSTLGQAVNELRFGLGYNNSWFGRGLSPDPFSGAVANQAGFRLNLGTVGATSAANSTVKSSRNPRSLLLENTVSWTRGAHAVSAGGSFTRTYGTFENEEVVPTIQFGLLASDPASALFTLANFPGSSDGQRNLARNLYALLIGRVSAIQASARIAPDGDEYVYLGNVRQTAAIRDAGLWIQDSWRPRGDLTLNLGLRYQLQWPIQSLNSSYSTATPADAWGISGLSATCTDLSRITPGSCNLFQPGITPGDRPHFVELGAGVRPYDVDWDNLAPSVGVSWTPVSDHRWLRTWLGDVGDTVLRAGWSRAFNQPALFDFTTRLDDNPGLTIDASRNESLGNLGSGLLLLREPDRLGPPAFPATRVYPMTDVETGDLQIFDPQIEVPYADTWSAGYQRALGRDMALEVRYVGTRSRGLWATYDLNETNIIENGFLDEFRLAQANLQANIAAGRGSTFRYAGPNTGTFPLPTYLAYFSGVPAALAGDAGRYTSTNFANSLHVNRLATFNPDPFTAVVLLLQNAAQRQNALTAGLPANLFAANPHLLGGSRIAGNGGFSNYHSLQIELRRRFAQGLQVQANYVYGQMYEGTFRSFRAPWVESLDDGQEGSVEHALKASWLFEFPIGTGRRFATNASPWLDRLVGGWQLHGIARVQSGRVVDFGNVRMVGFDRDDLQEMYRVQIDARGRVTMLPEDVIDNTIRAFSVSATSPTGYGSLGPPEGRYFAPASGPDCIESITAAFGSCGERAIEVAGPVFRNVDLALVKHIPIAGRVRAEFHIEALNAFNWVNFVPVTGIGALETAYEVTALNGQTTARVTQLTFRVSW